ncbi:hypothetical protein HF275_20845 [Rhizobium leguminosarum]|nr:hypothetical protein [Rhizobium leguminosarum]MBY3026730.1 hypothetical protein [Rhizobium leguminosarum]
MGKATAIVDDRNEGAKQPFSFDNEKVHLGPTADERFDLIAPEAELRSDHQPCESRSYNSA